MLISTHQIDCECIDCLAQYSPFTRLHHDELELVHLNKHVVTYNSGEMIVKQGSAMTHVVVIYSGLAKLYLEGLDGHNLILQLLTKRDFIVGPGIYTDFKHHTSISAVTNCTICFIDIQVYLDLLCQNMDFAKENSKVENLKRIKTYEKMICLTQKQMSGRIADVLLYLYDIYQTNPFEIDITRKDLAAMTSLSKESVIRILKQFREENVIRIRGTKIEILDLSAIKRLSQVG